MTVAAPSAAAWLEEIYEQTLASGWLNRDAAQAEHLAHAANADTSGRTYNTNEKETP